MCIDAQMLSAYMDGELKEPYKTQVEEHLEHCGACKKHLENLMKLSEKVKKDSDSDEKLSEKKDAIYEMLDKKYFASDKKVNFFRRKVEFSLSSMVTAAAAVVFIFIGGFMFFGTNQSQTDDILPSFAVQADSQNVRFVSSEKEASLDDYTLEEIMQYLDSKGYKVDISIKGLQPLEESKENQ